MTDTENLSPFAIQQTFPDQARTETPAAEPATPKRGRPATRKGTKANGETKPEPRQRRARKTMPSTEVEPAKPKRGRPTGKRAPKETSIPLSLLPVFKELSDEELSAVLQFADSVRSVFGKKSRTRIATAVGRLLG